MCVTNGDSQSILILSGPFVHNAFTPVYAMPLRLTADLLKITALIKTTEPFCGKLNKAIGSAHLLSVEFNIVKTQFELKTKPISAKSLLPTTCGKIIVYYDKKSFFHRLDFYGPNMVGFGLNLLQYIII